MVACSCTHFSEPGVEFVQAVHTNHVVDIAKLLQMITKGMHRFGQIGAFILNLLSRINDLLMQDLVAISEVVHTRAEHHRVLVHVDIHATLRRHELNNGLAILRLLVNFVGFHKLLVVFDLQEIVEAHGRF